MKADKKLKIGVISDTHLTGPDGVLKTLLEEHFADADMIFHAGDLVDLKVLEIFGDKDVRAVYGNMDNTRTRRELPEQLIMEINGFKIILIHGWGAPQGIEKRLVEKLGRSDCIVFGHTHYPVNRVMEDIYFFNPGSAVDKRFARDTSVGIIEIGSKIEGKIIALP
jgi:putative phosphoesterase